MKSLSFRISFKFIIILIRYNFRDSMLKIFKQIKTNLEPVNIVIGANLI